MPCRHLLAVTDAETNHIHVLSPDDADNHLYSFKYHRHPVRSLVYHPSLNFIVSADDSGNFEFWDPLTGSQPKDRLEFRFKTTTDLLLLSKESASPLSMALSESGRWLGVVASNRHVYVLETVTGKLHLDVDESVEVYKRRQAEGLLGMTQYDFNKRLGVENTIDVRW